MFPMERYRNREKVYFSAQKKPVGQEKGRGRFDHIKLWRDW